MRNVKPSELMSHEFDVKPSKTSDEFFFCLIILKSNLRLARAYKFDSFLQTRETHEVEFRDKEVISLCIQMIQVLDMM